MARTRGKSPGNARPARRVKSPAPAADNAGGAKLGEFELADLRRLIRLVQRTGIGELEVTSGGRTIRIAAHPGGTVVVGHAAAGIPAAGSGAPAAQASAATAAAAAEEKLVAITSPMVGTFYRAPAPDADPYVEQGDIVAIGQTVCIVEAMKLMNEIESEVKGRIVRIMVENAQPVEFGQKLFLLEPA